MRSPTRRDVLKLAGAAGVVPLLGAGPFHRRWRNRVCCESSFTDVARVTCDIIVIGEGFTVTINGHPLTGTGGGTMGKRYPDAWPIYYLSDGAGNWISSAPPLAPDHTQLWAPVSVFVNETSYSFTKHEFKIFPPKILMDTGIEYHIPTQIHCLPLYPGAPNPYSISCCFSCGDREYCIAHGNCIMCGTVRVCC